MSDLLSLGLFVFGMDSLAYSEFQRRMDWRHATSERFGARPAAQFLGPGQDSVSLSGTLVPEIQGGYGSIDRIIEMAEGGDNWPLVDGTGKVWGNFRILALDQTGRNIVEGGLPRQVDFTLELERAD